MATAVPIFCGGEEKEAGARAGSFFAATGGLGAIPATVDPPNDEVGGDEDDGGSEFGSCPLGMGERRGSVAGGGVDGVGDGEGGDGSGIICEPVSLGTRGIGGAAGG